MKTFTINAENCITVHASKKAARETGEGIFASAEELAELIGPDNKRLVEIWNGIPGVTPVTKFANRKVATERIWKAIQSLGEAAGTAGAEPEAAEVEEVRETGIAPVPVAAEPEAAAEVPETPFDEAPAAEQELAPPEPPADSAVPQAAEAPEQPAVAEPVADASAQAPDVAPAKTEMGKKAGRAKKAPKVPKVAKAAKSESGPREGSKTAQVVAMLKREGGVTISEIMSTMAWQKHTVRGFMAGAMKKAGYTVESFKPEGGERSYRINA